jgi:hypothetical protein
MAEVEVSRPRDATVRIRDGKPQVVPAVDGTRIEARTLAEAVEPVLTKKGDQRTAEVRLSGARATFSTEDAESPGSPRPRGSSAPPSPTPSTATSTSAGPRS